MSPLTQNRQRQAISHCYRLPSCHRRWHWWWCISAASVTPPRSVLTNTGTYLSTYVFCLLPCQLPHPQLISTIYAQCYTYFYWNVLYSEFVCVCSSLSMRWIKKEMSKIISKEKKKLSEFKSVKDSKLSVDGFGLNEFECSF